jgi:hypothetical protein
MKLARLLLFALIIAALNSYAATQGDARPAQQVPADDSGLVGDWRGASICVVRDSACRDEDSLYHVTKLAGKPGWFFMKLDKIVDGKPVTMGTVSAATILRSQPLLASSRVASFASKFRPTKWLEP